MLTTSRLLPLAEAALLVLVTPGVGAVAAQGVPAAAPDLRAADGPFPEGGACRRHCHHDGDCHHGGYNPCGACGKYQGTLMYHTCYRPGDYNYDDDDDEGNDDDDDVASSDRPAEDCVDDAAPRPIRRISDGRARFRFDMMYNDAHCVDADDEMYQYGQYDEVAEFSECADRCVNEGSTILLSSLVGFDWHCTHSTCRCLYAAGALGNHLTRDAPFSDQFDEMNQDYKGDGKVKGGKEKEGWYCAKLAQYQPNELGALQVDRHRGLRA